MANLGDKVKDKVTGFIGIIVSKTEYLNGCFRCGVQSLELDRGIPAKECWFDEPQLVVIEIDSVSTGPKNTGGLRTDIPSRTMDPR